MDRRERLERYYSDTYNSGSILKDRRPLIGISGNYRGGDCTLAEGYYLSLLEAGAIPIIIPPFSDIGGLDALLEQLDGVLLSGGADIDSLYIGEEPIEGLDINPNRDEPEILLVKILYSKHIPVLGICRGMQLLAAVLGGKLYQDIEREYPNNALQHSQSGPRSSCSHSVEIVPNTLLHTIMGAQRVDVNSFHHQAVKSVPPGFIISASAPDGIIEAMESVEFSPVMAVQWHPECMLAADDRRMMPLFEWLVSEANTHASARRFHRANLTIDSHCDSPIFFQCGAHFGSMLPQIDVEYSYVGEVPIDGKTTFKYNPRVNLYSMYHGGLDGVFMVAYLPQGERTPLSLSRAAERADKILSLVESRVAELDGMVEIARTPEDLYENCRRGVKSVVLAVENGYAIGDNIANVERFAARGVAYMTLCHNGDNDICDSARGLEEHNGISQFGRSVIAEMNRVGMMVDVSHASERSFYDALALSKVPIVCSHSSCRALCNHPRNLTDSQMRSLAQMGGVMQVCIYDGFLRRDTPATVDDVVRHILHAVEIMGIDGVGIGTDFDGGGGVPGMSDASWSLSLTKRLMRCGLTDVELAKIWGGNFVRVWRAAREYSANFVERG